MNKTESDPQISVKNVMYLTDFSEPSAAALPVAAALARSYGSKVFMLNVFRPGPYLVATSELMAAIDVGERDARKEISRLGSRFTGLEYEPLVIRDDNVWVAIERAIKEYNINVLVAGTHGRTGLEKFLLGSIAEEVFRRATIPVLTVGPAVRGAGGAFKAILLASDFASASHHLASYAASIANRNEAHLFLLHVVHRPRKANGHGKTFELSVAEAIHHLYELVPRNAELCFPPEVAVEYGDPAERIIDAARTRKADLIVMGLRKNVEHLGAATHLGGSTAHKVVAQAHCPVLTVPAVIAS